MIAMFEFILSMVANLVDMLFDTSAFANVGEIPFGYYLIGFFVLWLGFNVFIITVTSLGSVSSFVSAASKAIGKGDNDGNNS